MEPGAGLPQHGLVHPLGVEGRVPHAQLGARGNVARGGEVHVAAVLEGRQVLVAGLRRRPHQHHPVAVVLVGGVEAHGVPVLLEHLRVRAARYPAVCASVRVCARVGSGGWGWGWWLLNNLGDATSQAKPGSVRALTRRLVMGGPRETLDRSGWSWAKGKQKKQQEVRCHGET